MVVHEIPIEKIKPYPNNPRINDRAVNAVIMSIRKYGFRVPLVLSPEYEIVTGHTRYEAAKALDYKTISCVIADDLTDKELKAFRLADNKTGELAKWDIEKLETELNLIDDVEIERLFNKILPDEQTEIDDTDSEIDLTDYEDEAFDYECQLCGFKFNA